MTRVGFSDGRGINYSGRLTQRRAVELASEQLRQWNELGMADDALKSFGVIPVVIESLEQARGLRAPQGKGDSK